MRELPGRRVSPVFEPRLVPEVNPLTETTPALVIGAGSAGLASAACLRRRGVDAVVLEQSDAVGPAWRRHYDRLHLHTAKGSSGLPGFPMPADYPRYASRDQVVAYLEAYAAHHGIEPRFGARVVRAARDGTQWLVETADGEAWRTPHLVVASGYTRVPQVPSLPGRELFEGQTLHSSEYHNGKPWRGKHVLVVGFGNSGGEIAIDLTECGATAALSVRSAVNVLPKEILGIPILSWGIAMSALPSRMADALAAPLQRIFAGDITKVGLRKLSYGPQVQIAEHGRIPLIDIGTMALLKSGAVEVHPGLDRFDERGMVFDDGTRADFDAVVFATGYRPKLADFLDAPDGVLDEGGTPHRSGPNAAPGLHFCGMRVSPTGMLREAGIEARAIAEAVEDDDAAPASIRPPFCCRK